MSAPIPFSKRVQENIDEAQANFHRYERMLEKPEDFSWGVVFLFYSALHLLEAYARQYTPHNVPKKHELRLNYVSTHLNEIFRQYDKLFTACNQCRYHCIKFNQKEMNILFNDNFAVIRKRFRTDGIEWKTVTSSAMAEKGAENK